MSGKAFFLWATPSAHKISHKGKKLRVSDQEKVYYS
jgi:hypothetical protein